MKKTIYISWFLFLFIACNSGPFLIQNLNNNQITIIGHGGMGIESLYPINSLESILKAINSGADGIELDIQMTKDSVLVAYHDSKLEKSTHAEGEISSKNWEEINNLTYKFPPFSNYKLVNLEEIIESITTPQEYTFVFDCSHFKPSATPQEEEVFTNKIVELIQKYSLQNNVKVELRRRSMIESFKQKLPEIPIFIYLPYNQAISIATELNLQGITISLDDITHSQIEAAHDLGFQIAVFNTHSHKRNIDAIEKNVDYIQTDKVKHLVRMLR